MTIEKIEPFSLAPSLRPPSGVVIRTTNEDYQEAIVLLTLRLGTSTIIDLYRNTGIPVRTLSKILDNLSGRNLVAFQGSKVRISKEEK
jgi:uncharacterized membrane protein